MLLVKVAPKQFLWLPFFSRSSFDVRLVYASDGTLAWMDDTSVQMTESPSIRMDGHFSLVDSSVGLMTLRGQVRYLGRQAAAELLKAVDAHLY